MAKVFVICEKCGIRLPLDDAIQCMDCFKYFHYECFEIFLKGEDYEELCRDCGESKYTSAVDAAYDRMRDEQCGL